MNIHSYIYEEIKSAIKQLRNDDVYAISFFVYDDDDDISKPTLTVGYNTLSNYEEEASDAYDKQEAKWNYAFWPHNKIYEFGFDAASQTIIEEWIEANSIVIEEEKEEDMYDENMSYVGKGPVITQRFVNELIIIANRLHDEGITLNNLGEKIPVIIHELEYYEAIAEENDKANPEGQAMEFINWVRNQ